MSQEADAESNRMDELARMAEQDIRQLWKVFRMLGYTDDEIQSEFRTQVDKRAMQIVN